MKFKKALKHSSIILLLLIIAFTGCKKVININLNSTNPRYVVEGNITNTPAPYMVTITKTVNFDQDNVYPKVSGALVVVTDVTANQTDTLTEASAGNYHTHIITGVPGHTYSLYVSDSGNIFTATSTMPQPVTLDSIYTTLSAFGKNIEIVPVYYDPILVNNHYHYYHFMEYISNQVSSRVVAREDDLINGQVMKLPINSDKINVGDSVRLYLECVDSAVYIYYETLSLTQNRNSATPANPLTNITGGALGYFSAHTSSMKGIRVN